MKTVKQAFILIGIAMAFGALVNLIHPRRILWIQAWQNHVETQAVEEGIPLVQLSELIEVLRDQSRVVVDARSAGEYARGHIPGAISIPFESTAAEGTIPVELLRSGSGPVFYCTGPAYDEALMLAIAVRETGRDDAAVFVGGIELWGSELLAVEEGAAQ